MTVRELLSDPERWTKGAWALNQAGAEVNAISSDAKCWCLVGAISRCYRTDDEQQPIRDASAKVKALILDRHATIVDFNDSPKTTHADILAVLDEAGI